jgi:hypothetical protein
VNYELNENELKLNWKLIKSELKLNKKLDTWVNIQKNERHDISIHDTYYFWLMTYL